MTTRPRRPEPPSEGTKTLGKTSWIARTLKKPKFSTRQRFRCKLCGRPRGYYRKFGICRVCFRVLALRGEIPGVRKASW